MAKVLISPCYSVAAFDVAVHRPLLTMDVVAVDCYYSGGSAAFVPDHPRIAAENC